MPERVPRTSDSQVPELPTAGCWECDEHDRRDHPCGVPETRGHLLQQMPVEVAAGTKDRAHLRTRVLTEIIERGISGSSDSFPAARSRRDRPLYAGRIVLSGPSSVHRSSTGV